MEPTESYYFKEDDNNHLAIDITYIKVPKVNLNNVENSETFPIEHFSIANKPKIKRKRRGQTQDSSGSAKCHICFEGNFLLALITHLNGINLV